MNNRIKLGWTFAEAVETPKGETPERLRELCKKEENPCKGCIYYAYLSNCTEDGAFCSYYLDTKSRRGCSAGAECTVRKEGQRNRRTLNAITLRKEYRRFIQKGKK